MHPRRPNMRLNFDEIQQTAHPNEQNVGNFSQIPQSFTQNMGNISEIPQSSSQNHQNMRNYSQNFPFPYSNVQQFPDPSMHPNFSFNPYSMGNYYPYKQNLPPLATPQQSNTNLNKFVLVDEGEDEVHPAPPVTQPKKTTWTSAEDEALISCYLKCTEDPVVGTGQKSRDLWKRVEKMYKECTLSNTSLSSSRNVDALRGRWTRLQKSVLQWVAVYDEVNRMKRSGMTEENVMHEAHTLYERTHKSKFTFYEQWILLRQSPRWMLSIEKKYEFRRAN